MNFPVLPTAYTVRDDANIILQMLVGRVDIVTVVGLRVLWFGCGQRCRQLRSRQDFTGVKTVSLYGLSQRRGNANWHPGGGRDARVVSNSCGDRPAGIPAQAVRNAHPVPGCR